MEKNINNINQSILGETEDLFTGELDLKRLTEKAATIISNKSSFIGVGIFIIKNEQLTLHSYSQNKITNLIKPLIEKIEVEISIPLDHDKNIMIQTLKNRDIRVSDNLNFFHQSKIKKIAEKVHSITKAKKQLTAPITFKTEVFGVAIFSTRNKAFSKEEINTIERFCLQLGKAFKNSFEHQRLVEKLIKNNQTNQHSLEKAQLEAIKNIHNLLATKTNKNDVYKTIISEIAQKIHATYAVILEWNEENSALTFQNINVPTTVISSIEKIIKGKLSDISIKDNDPDTQQNQYIQALKTGKILTTEDLNDAAKGVISESVSRKAQKILGMKMAVAIPLQFNGERLGVLGLSWKKESISEAELKLLETYGEHLSLALYNIKRFDEDSKIKEKPSYHDTVLAATNQLFAGEFDFEKVSRQAVTDFNNDMGFYGVNIYRKDGSSKLRAYLYSTGKATDFIRKIIPDNQYQKLTIPLKKAKSIIARAGSEEDIFETQNFENFANGIISETVMKLMKQALPKDIWYTSFPILNNNNLEGVLAVGKRGSKLTPQEKEATQFFCEQLGLAMANIKAHNKILERYQKNQELRARNIDPDKKPTIKFTLRISKEIERYLTWKIHNTDQSKADFLRNLLTEDVIKNDHDYQDFLKQ
jgi:GAF domain-containing protein